MRRSVDNFARGAGFLVSQREEEAMGGRRGETLVSSQPSARHEGRD